MMAAVSGPMPNTLVTVVLDASSGDVTATDLGAGGVEGADFLDQLACRGQSLEDDGFVGVHAGQELLSPDDGQGLGGATFDDHTHQGVSPTDRPGPLSGDLMIAVG